MLKIILLILLPISIFSDVKIVNKDKVAYKLFIEKDNSAEHTSINAKTKAIACQTDCKILIKKTKKIIKAKDGDTIIIENGKFAKKIISKIEKNEVKKDKIKNASTTLSNRVLKKDKVKKDEKTIQKK